MQNLLAIVRLMVNLVPSLKHSQGVVD